ncbi:hypothetical protein HF670_16100 [Acidithiobacillus thiooxidans]|uniref:hypothetical protein n=1 Tax=Acidithiobacillus thiooxidans TaxID=930 RepID=UPI001C065A51|nr:hypothetical protein [Acidithiobacillus thiooxidans]MBU2841018.1 hypothetical protein [Acidithiobacillus thiooxidans]
MTKVSVTEAARLAGIARSYFYKRYIDSGEISIERDMRGNPLVDVSEIMRVFGELKGQVEDTSRTQQRTEDDTSNSHEDAIVLRAELSACREILRVRETEVERLVAEVGWLREQVAQQRLLTGPDTKRRWWWPW